MPYYKVNGEESAKPFQYGGHKTKLFKFFLEFLGVVRLFFDYFLNIPTGNKLNRN